MYEIICVLPGNATEQEVAAKVSEIEEKIKALEITISDRADLGRQKLAYPMRHLPYGHFVAFYIEGDNAQLTSARVQLERQLGLLRVFVRSFNPETQAKAKAEITNTSMVERRFKRKGAQRTPAPVVQASVVTASAAPAEKDLEPVEEAVKTAAATHTPEEVKSAPVNLEDIDKKLDEILESDLIPDSSL